MLLRVKEITKNYEITQNTMRAIWYKTKKNGQKVVNTAKQGRLRKFRMLRKFHSLRKFSNTAKFYAMLTLPLTLAPIAICFVHAASSLARVLRI